MPAKKWVVAPSLETLRKQLNKHFPKRSTKSDGGIGDAAHASRNSDHNPYIPHPTLKNTWVVRARDFTHDPQTGIDCHWLAKTLVKNRDPRIRYIIWNKKIIKSYGIMAWKWRDYDGSNSHTHHLHLSVVEDPKLFMKDNDWDLDFPDNKDADDVARIEPNTPALVDKVSTETIVEEKPKPYNDVGLRDTLISDAKAVVPANVGFNIADVVAQASGVPVWAVKIISILIATVATISAIWLVYRIVSYLMHNWRENERIKLKTNNNADPTKKDVISLPPPSVDASK